jgi:hypothetical protein
MSMTGNLAQLTLADLETIARDPKALGAILERASTLSLDKMWNGLQFLLDAYVMRNTRAPDLLDQAVVGGDPVGLDLGYSPACVLRPDEVKLLSEALTAVDGKLLRDGFDADQMKDTYPSSIWSEGEPVVHELMTAFVDLVAFYQAAASAGCGMATYLT